MMKTEAIHQETSIPVKQQTNKQEVSGRQEAGQVGRTDANTARQAHNMSIMKASMEVSLSVGNNSLNLLFKSAVENLNAVLEPDFGPNAIQNAADSGIDVSPQATADRIVSMSTAFFSKYQEVHPEKDLETALKDFTKLIGSGIDKGFAEARNILDGLKVLQGDIASNIDKTYEMVQSGLKSFVDNYPRPDKQSAPA